MLHMEIIQERLEREFDMTVITTVPNVSYIAHTKKGVRLIVNNPSDLPEPNYLESVEEPYIAAQIITKSEYVGVIMKIALLFCLFFGGFLYAEDIKLGENTEKYLVPVVLRQPRNQQPKS